MVALTCKVCLLFCLLTRNEFSTTKHGLNSSKDDSFSTLYLSLLVKLWSFKIKCNESFCKECFLATAQPVTALSFVGFKMEVVMEKISVPITRKYTELAVNQCNGP